MQYEMKAELIYLRLCRKIAFMRKFILISKWFLLLFSLALFVCAPTLDLNACSDCSSSIQGKSSPEHLCSFCFNTAGMVSHHIFDTPSLSTPMDILRPMMAFSDPSFPIDKPPQN